MSSIPGPHHFNPSDCDECLNSPPPEGKIVTHTDWDENDRLVRVDPVNIIGLDLSLTATGVAGDQKPGVISYKMPPQASELERVKRLKYLGVAIDKACRGANVVVIEGHSFGSRNTHAHSLGELHGIVKVTLLQRATPFVIVPPSVLKKYACGKGNVGKDEVLATAVRDGFPGHDNNAADAWWLRQMGLAHYLNRDEVAPKHRQVVVQAIRWPRIVEAVSA